MRPRLLTVIAVLVLTAGAKPPMADTYTVPDSIPIASYTFDDGFGGPDLQGWTTADFTLQLGTYFHIEDFAGLTHPASPLAGSKSMWCGVRPDQVCNYALPPGYGSYWDQSFESIPFVATGDVTVTFLARFDTEVGYDHTFLDYFTTSERWHTLRIFDNGVEYPNHADSLVSETIPADSLAGTVRIRVRVVTDGSWDDETGLVDSDGAVFIDSLLVEDSGGTIDFQDFEAEAVDALVTLDGDWMATTPDGVGDYAGLFDGSTVLQRDTVTTNTTWLWGFFNGSTDTQACLGYPSDPAVPVTQQGIENYAVSPVIDLTPLHIDGQLPEWVSVHAALDMYMHTILGIYPHTSYVRGRIIVRGQVNGCWQQWSAHLTYAGGFGQWERITVPIGSYVDPTATHIQLGVGVLDLVGSPCHTNAPLYDNVSVYALAESTVTGVDAGTPQPAGFALYQNVPNPFNPATTIRFDVPEGGARITLSVYDVAGRLVARLVDDHRGAGRQSVVWDGRNHRGARVASGVYFYHLKARGFTATRKMVVVQ